MVWTPNAGAISFLSFDARSIAMGGTGVVTARPHNASLFNPALLIHPGPRRPERLLGHLYAGARLTDRDNFLDAARDFRDKYEDTSLDDLLDETIELTPTRYTNGDDLRAATRRVRELQADINGLSQKPLRAAASYGFAFARPFRKEWSVGGYYRRFLVLGSVVDIAGEDNAALDRITTTVDLFADLVDEVRELTEEAEDERDSLDGLTLAETIEMADDALAAVEALEDYVDYQRLRADVLMDDYENNNLEDYLREPIPEHFYSTIETRGADVSEQALSLARSFTSSALPGQINLGVSLKYVEFIAIDFRQGVQEFSLSAYRALENRRTYKRLNADLGLVYDPPTPLQLGLSLRNLVPYDFETAFGDTLKMRPVARLGVGYVTQQLRFSLDADLTRNEPLGFDPDKQYLSFGTEWFIWRNTALRAGLRTNMVDGETLPSLGFGLGGNHGHLDLAVARSLNGDQWSLGLQAGLAF